MKELTVKDLLTMSVGQEPAGMGGGSEDDWITTFIKNEPVHKPGTVFLYNNMATFMLSAMALNIGINLSINTNANTTTADNIKNGYDNADLKDRFNVTTLVR